jgi:hypothetical protein
MKLLLTVVFALSSLSALAAMNEIECRGQVGEKSFLLEIEEPFPRDRQTRDARLTITEEGAMTTHRYWITNIRTWSMNRTRFSGAGLTLDFDHWPDSRPRWGRTYDRSSLRVRELGNQEVRNVSCQYLGMNF